MPPNYGVPALHPVTPSPRTDDSPFVPHRYRRFDDFSVCLEDPESVKVAGEPAVVRHGDDRALECSDRLLQRLCRFQVEVVGGLVKQ